MSDEPGTTCEPGDAGVTEQYRRALAERREVTFEFHDEALHKWLEVSATPDGAGTVTTFRDVSARRRDALLVDGNREVLTRIAENAPLPTVLEAVIGMVERHSEHGALGSVLLLSDDDQHLVHGAAPSLPDEYNRAIDGIRIGPAVGSCGTAAYRGSQVVVEDISTDPLWAGWSGPALAAGLRSCWSTPVFAADGRLLATFAIYYREPRVPGPSDQRLIEQVTRTVAIAIQHEQDRQKLVAAAAAERRASERSRRLHKLAAALSAAVEPAEVASLVAREAMAALHAEGAWLALAPDTGLLAATAPGAPADQVYGFGAISEQIADLDARQRVPGAQWLEDREGIAEQLPGLQGRAAFGSIAILPLRAGRQYVGKLGICRAAPGGFDRDDKDEAIAIASLCAQSLLRAERHASTKHLAETLQRSLLAEAPPAEGFEIEVAYRPAVRAAEVGGDWYDAFPLPNGSLALVIGDVVGHDIRAAAAMGQLRSMVRALACESESSPADVLCRLDRLVAQLAVTTFASLILVIIERRPRDGGHPIMSWANAGHPSPIVICPDTGARVLTAPIDPPLGVGGVAQRTDARADLPPGATLLLYTDGLVETRGEALDERIAELATRTSTLASAPLAQFRNAILDHIERPTDDIALLAVRVLPD